MPLLKSSQTADAGEQSRPTTRLSASSRLRSDSRPRTRQFISRHGESTTGAKPPTAYVTPTMAPQRRASEAACATPPAKKRATDAIVIGHALGLARPSGVPAATTTTPVAFSPPCMKLRRAPQVSPGTREVSKRKLTTPPRAAPVETRTRSSRRVNRRIFADALDKMPNTSPPSDHMLMIQPRILPLPDTSKWGRPTQVLAETYTTSARSELTLILQPPLLPLPDLFRSRALVSEATSANASSEETLTTQPETALHLDPPGDEEHTHDAAGTTSADASSEDSFMIDSDIASLPDALGESELSQEDPEPLGAGASNELAMILAGEPETQGDREEATIPAPPSPTLAENTPNPHESVDVVPLPPLELQPMREDAPAGQEDWWDMTYIHDLTGDEPTRHANTATSATAAALLPHIECGVWRWTAELKREAFSWILCYLQKHLEIGRERQREALIRYLEMPQSIQGLFVCGTSVQSTGTIVRSLLDSLEGMFGGRRLDVTDVKGELYSSSEEIYSCIRARLKCKWDFPPWRRIEEFTQQGKTVAGLDPSKLSVVVLENIDPHVKDGDSKQPALDRLLRFLNAHVFARGLKFIVIGHEAKTIRRFSRQFGGFSSGDVEQYVLRLPRYSVKSLSAHIDAVIASAVATMISIGSGDTTRPLPPLSSLLNDLFAPKAVQFAAQKALKQNQCELDPVLLILRRALVRMLSSCRYRSEYFERDASLWRLRYEHVTAVTTEYFKHDYVHRIQCVGVIPQTVLLVLIDAGPCTEEQLFHHVCERRLVHSWVMVITTFRSTMFDPALELLLSVPVVKKREARVCMDGTWRVGQELYALPTREHLIEAAGKEERIRLLL